MVVAAGFEIRAKCLASVHHETTVPDLITDPAGVKTEEIRKGRIWAVLRDIWRVFASQKTNEKQIKT